jgi:hypothetical protein
MVTHALRHLALRLWLTVLVGGLGSLALVPLLQTLMGLTWVALPVIGFLALIFLAMGWLLNTWAGLLIERLRAEGAVWERAGMRREASERYKALMGVVDSFMLSPGRRRRMLASLLPMMTRFYLDQERGGPLLDRLLRAHLEAHPGDADVAAKWLRMQIDQMDPPTWVHDLAQRIAEALSESDEITALLVAFYLSHGRSDHAAMGLYHRYWQAAPDFRSAKAVTLAQLLSTEGHRDLWALDVYLTAWTQGAPQEPLRPAIRRCLAVASPADAGDPLLERARALIGSVSSPSWEHRPMGADEPPVPTAPLAATAAADADLDEEAAFVYRRRRRPRRTEAWVTRAGRDLGSRLLTIGPHLGRLGRWCLKQILKPWGKALGLVAVALALILLIANTVEHLRPSPSPPPPPIPETTSTVSDPFTIQVAAYLKAEDAQRVAAQLKAKGLDAYWTEAVGAKRNWYQVRIDHFATKAAARKFGEDLKTKGLINDFYVANYRSPQAPAEK